MSGSVKNVILLIVLVVLLGGAGFMFYRSSKTGEMPGGPETVTEWICVKCGALHEWDGRELDKLKADPQKAKMIPAARMQVFYCDECGDFTIVRAHHCDRHDKWFPTKDLSGRSLDCPECEKEFAGN